MKLEKYELDSLRMPIRQIYIYMLILWNPETLTPRVFAYNTSQECLDAFLLYKDTAYQAVTFSHRLVVVKGHPLYDIADEIPDFRLRKCFEI